MTSRMSVSKAKQYLEKLHENIMEAVNLYFVSDATKWLSGMRGRSQAGSLATNPRTQATQSPWKDSKTGAMQVLPSGHVWGTSGSIARYNSIFTEPENSTVGLRMALDVLLTRVQPPVIVYVAARALATLPKTLLASECKKRLGAAGPAFCKWIEATAGLADAILEVGAEKKRRKKATRISWSELSTPRKAKSKTPNSKPKADTIHMTADEGKFCHLLLSKLPKVEAGMEPYELATLARAALGKHSLAELQAMSKEQLNDAIRS